MIIKVQNETPFQVLSNSFTIGPSTTGYELQVGATSRDFTTLFTVAADTPRMVTNVANGSYFRLKNNSGEVEVNWSRTCKDEGGSGSGSSVSVNQILSAGTEIASITVDSATTTLYAPEGGGNSNVIELTQAEYDALVDKDPNTTYIISDAQSINMDNYASQADLTTLSGNVETALAGKADAANVTASGNNLRFPKWNDQGIITGTTGNVVYESYININGSNQSVLRTGASTIGPVYAPTTAGSAGQPLLSNGSGAPVWGTYKFQFITQTEYDALTTKDANTIFFIVGD